ncbi:hypothetical protein FQN60_008331 [Etheostoma spectabile]|uniref:C2 domain-containing protein n=1 Tax=Etheostoma spectabile TaxID=54343 RepID=A0A5J5CV67_9PERO|nr:hypothetical protein FQN60_008331 [Etheostoma spectabile]
MRREEDEEEEDMACVFVTALGCYQHHDERPRGKLKLSIIQEQEVLVVSVLEARAMVEECHGPCDSYVKIGMFPDNDPSNRQKTQMVPHCRNPIFLQTFYLMSALLGCMSFGVRSLMDKEVQGWYYLLEEELGRKKHLKVPTQHKHPSTEGGPFQCVRVRGNEPRRLKDVMDKKLINFLMSRHFEPAEEGGFVLELREMCSRGTVSARDSFVYISEAVLSNHGAAPETNRPENMQCLTSSHERPCQKLQCGLSRPSQRQSRLHDAAPHSHTADLRGYCDFCRSRHRSRSWTVFYGIPMQEEKRAKKRCRKDEERTIELKF